MASNYYQNTRKSFQKRLIKDTNSANMLVRDIEIFLKRRKK